MTKTNINILYYSPLSRSGLLGKLRKGKVGAEHEVCTLTQRDKCEKEDRKCQGYDKDAFSICRGITDKEVVLIVKKDK